VLATWSSSPGLRRAHASPGWVSSPQRRALRAVDPECKGGVSLARSDPPSDRARSPKPSHVSRKTIYRHLEPGPTTSRRPVTLRGQMATERSESPSAYPRPCAGASLYCPVGGILAPPVDPGIGSLVTAGARRKVIVTSRPRWGRVLRRALADTPNSRSAKSCRAASQKARLLRYSDRPGETPLCDTTGRACRRRDETSYRVSGNRSILRPRRRSPYSRASARGAAELRRPDGR
jgi:hypothetical protein